ncbi:MAG: hypothetical protein K2Z80_06435 [Xanthobacteraceae bacterium]|nr:hypothetical protein [Xanthobacteraceae bacterium]
MIARSRVTLLITNSIDYVADLLVARLGSEKVFRYNTDLWPQYGLLVSGDRIEISDPTDRSIDDASIAKVYRRSSMRRSMLFPQLKLTDLERYAEEEVHAAWTDLLNIFCEQGKLVLSQPLATQRSGKLQQLRLAEKYFRTTPHRFLLNRDDLLRTGVSSVCKSFNFKFADGIGFYSSRVDEGDLDSTQPWFLTDYVDATHDVTVAVVRDELFAFELDRSIFIENTIDWRQSPVRHAHRGWNRIEIPAQVRNGIFNFMNEVGQHFARIDFLRKDDQYTFLEANYNGEWGWLDPDATEGLMLKIVHEIHPDTPCVNGPGRPRS